MNNDPCIGLQDNYVNKNTYNKSIASNQSSQFYFYRLMQLDAFFVHRSTNCSEVWEHKSCRIVAQVTIDYA